MDSFACLTVSVTLQALGPDDSRGSRRSSLGRPALVAVLDFAGLRPPGRPLAFPPFGWLAGDDRPSFWRAMSDRIGANARGMSIAAKREAQSAGEARGCGCGAVREWLVWHLPTRRAVFSRVLDNKPRIILGHIDIAATGLTQLTRTSLTRPAGERSQPIESLIFDD